MSIAPPSAATWDDVEAELRRLAASGERFATTLSPDNRIDRYEHDERISLVNEHGTRFLEIECIRGCWETLERQGSIRRRDVLEPGRCSALMMALFARIPGVVVEERDEQYLVLSGSAPS